LKEFTASAPARANLIGEHTDYIPNGGHVLPTPLPFHTEVSVRETGGPSGRVMIASGNFPGETFEGAIGDAKRGAWTDYVVGCLQEAAKKVALPALDIHIKSDVPFGCGISSSAALCVGTVRAVKGLVEADWSDVDIAEMAFHAEHDFVGVPCGRLDQYASSVGLPGQALLLDTKTLVFRNVALPPGIAIMLVDCGVKHDLAKGDSHQKRLDRLAQCTKARDLLGVGTLCELGYDDLPRIEAIEDAVVRRRARHVVTENLRVLAFAEALEAGDDAEQAELIAQSHLSQRDDFEVTIPEIDALVESSNRFGVRGARICGGGFGGAIIALVPQAKAADWWTSVSKENPNGKLISTYALAGKRN
jgi:galactokinase